MSIEKLRPSFTFTADRLRELEAVAPEAFADGRINWDALREALGAYLEEEGRDAEHFGLFWPGKRDARRLAALPSQGTLVPAPGEGVNEDDTHNVFIEGDNLEVLKLLQKSYAGRVKMIYIDPPYNTGNDFVYKDDFSEPVEDYLRKTGQTDEAGQLLTTNSRADGRFHSNWLNMMYPRLRLARSLLRDDGVIFVSIDDNEAHNLRAMMNEIFGEESFVADVVVVNNLKGRNDKRHIATAHERLLMYTREQFQEYGLELPEERLGEFDLEDEIGGKYRLLGLRKRGGADTRQQRPKMFFPLYVNPASGRVSLERTHRDDVEVWPQKSDGIDGCWRWGKEKVCQHIDALIGRPVGGKDKYDVFEKDYLETNGVIRRLKPKSVMMGSNYSTDGATKAFRLLFPEAPFRNPKPVPFMRDLINYSSIPDKEEIILDFFAGSCTTAQAIFELNREDGGDRRFIMVQIPEPTDSLEYPTIAEIGKERIRRVIAKMQSDSENQLDLRGRETPEDLGFRVFKLARSNYKAWQDYQGDDIEQVESLFDRFETPLVDGWQPEDLLTEIMLMEGFPLDSEINDWLLDSLTVDSDACDHRLFVCLEPVVDIEMLDEVGAEGIGLRSEDIFVCLDSALTDQAKARLADACNLKII